MVTQIGDEVALERFCRTGPDTIELQPESHNPEHQAIRFTPDTADFEIVGRVVGAVVDTRHETEE